MRWRRWVCAVIGHSLVAPPGYHFPFFIKSWNCRPDWRRHADLAVCCRRCGVGNWYVQKSPPEPPYAFLPQHAEQEK